MSTELIKLKIKKQSSSGDKAQKIIDKFIEACLALDASIFEPMIAEEEYFEDIEKFRFLSSLKRQYDWAIARGAKDMSLKRGKCLLCVVGKDGDGAYEFYGNRKSPEFAYIIHTEREEVKDIFLCNLSSGRRGK